jgi:hypothetical protein
MERNMGSGAGQDLAVVMFSGHGTMIDCRRHDPCLSGTCSTE